VRRVFVVDDSAAVRARLGDRLRAEGYDVEAFPDAEHAAERALETPPDVVITDLIMPGLSGVQLCRLLRADPATTHVPVLLLTASGDKRSRFWARSAGAAAYLGKDRLDDLIATLPQLVAPPVSMPQMARRGRTLAERISAVFDAALFESVLAGEVRSLASSGTLPHLFEGLCRVVSDVMSYRWLALLPTPAYAALQVHAHPSESVACEEAARKQLGAPAARDAHVVSDDRALAGDGGPARAIEVLRAAGGASLGRVAIAPTARGFARDEERLFAMLASELAAPLEMTVLHEDARRLATTDPLTGLLNRRAFLDALTRERSRADRHQFPISLLLLDVDHFKSVNDRHGHAAGDTVLRGVAEVLARVARRSDYVGRWGGEEFVLALAQTGGAGAEVAAERLRRGISRAVHAMPGGAELKVTVSIGVASSDSPWSPESLIGAADRAMYLAKDRGRDRVEHARLVETHG
jgi:two-component system cell cycle response regulator